MTVTLRLVMITKSSGIYYRARYYDPNNGRFISEDPIGFGGDGANFYGYVENSPIGENDPTGLCKYSRVCIYRALEEVLAAGETPGVSRDEAYRTNTKGKVAISKNLPQYVGETDVVITPAELAGLKGNPKIFVQVGKDKKGNPIYSSAFGRYQLTASGIAGDFTDWSPTGQDSAVGKALINIGAVKAAEGGDFAGAMADIAQYWVSMPGGNNKKIHVTFERAKNIYANAFATLPECKN